MNTVETRRAAALKVIQEVARKAGLDRAAITERRGAFYLQAPNGDIAKVAWEPQPA